VKEVVSQCWQYEESLFSSPFSAVEKLPLEVQQFKDNMSPPVQASISAIKHKHFSALERGYRDYTPWGTLWFYLHDHRQDMRKWDGKPTSSLEA